MQRKLPGVGPQALQDPRPPTFVRRHSPPCCRHAAAAPYRGCPSPPRETPHHPIAMLHLRAVLAQGSVLLRGALAPRRPPGCAPPCMRTLQSLQPSRHASGGMRAASQPSAAAGGSDGSSGASSAPSPAAAAAASYQEWRDMWAGFLKQLFSGGHYAADPGVGEDELDSDSGTCRAAAGLPNPPCSM